MMALLGAGENPFRNFVGGSVGDSEASPTTAVASVTMATDGAMSFAGNSPPAAQDWYTPTTVGIGSSYWVVATLNSGSLSSGTTGSTLALSSNRTWQRNQASLGASAANITLRIYSDAGATQLVATATFQLDAEQT